MEYEYKQYLNVYENKKTPRRNSDYWQKLNNSFLFGLDASKWMATLFIRISAQDFHQIYESFLRRNRAKIVLYCLQLRKWFFCPMNNSLPYEIDKNNRNITSALWKTLFRFDRSIIDLIRFYHTNLIPFRSCRLRSLALYENKFYKHSIEIFTGHSSSSRP